MKKSINFSLVILLGTCFYLISRLSFTAWPEMLAWPYLMLNGWLPYKDIGIAHTPLLLVVLEAFYKLFGVGIIQLKIFTWLLILLNIFLLHFIAKKIYDKKIAKIAVFVYTPLVFAYSGNGLWFDLALVPFVLLLFYFWQKKRFLPLGIVFALGVLTKQTLVYFSLPLLYLLWKQKINFKDIQKIFVGGLSILVLFLITLVLFGIADDFYFWAIKFGILYLPNAVGQISLPNIKEFIFFFSPFMIAVFNPALIPWIIAGVAGVYPRWELFHFQPALPFVALAFANFFASKKYLKLKNIVLIVLLVFLLLALKRQIGGGTRFYEDDVKRVVDQVEMSGVKEIYVVNYWDSVYSLTATTPSVRPLIPYIPWYLEYRGYKAFIISNLKLNQPRTIVVKDRNQLNWEEMENLIDRYYDCSWAGSTVEVCNKFEGN